MSKPISKEMAGQGAPGDEFIVEVDFDYCGVSYSGYQILTRTQIVKLCKQLESDRQIGTPNMPGDWWEEFDVSDLNGAFTIHSDRLEDVEAMRGLFGESVGNTELFEEAGDGLWEEDEDGIIDEELAKAFIEDPDNVDLSGTEITDEAAEALSKSEGCLKLNGLTELSDAAAESLSKYKGELGLSGLTELSDAAAESLSKCKGDLHLNGLSELINEAAEFFADHKGCLELSGLTKLSDAMAESFSKHQGDLLSLGLTELSDAAAESLSKHKGVLFLDGLTELSDAAAAALAQKPGTINHQSPPEWVADLCQ
jgi:hypothetical protein